MRTRQVIVSVGAALATLGPVTPWAQTPSPSQAQTQRPPVFRAGTNFVLVDAYPQRGGQIVEGLTAGDFQVFEDGKPQAIESFEFVRVEPGQVESARKDPNSLNDMRIAAADPHNRVFVTFLDTLHTTVGGSHAIRAPLVDTLNRIVGPTDLFGVTTQNMRPQDLTLGRRRETVEEQLSKYWPWGERQRLASDPNDPGEDDLATCFHMRETAQGAVEWLVPDGPVIRFFDEILIERRREDRILTALEQMSAYLGTIREARTVLLVVTNGWLLLPTDQGLMNEIARDVRATGLPPLVNAPVGTGGTPSRAYPAGAKLTTRELSFQSCIAEATHLLLLDQPRRYRDLIALANRNNVSVYPVATSGLAVFDGIDASQRVFVNPNVKADQEQTIVGRDHRRLGERVSNLRTIAENTDGIAVVETNDLAAGLRRIVDDVSAYYLLGYYSTNTKFDGKFRRIEVKMKPPALSVHARRGYLSPAEPRAGSVAPAPAAPVGASVDGPLGVLSRLREASDVFVHGSATLIDVAAVVEVANRRLERGAWMQGADVRIELADAAGRRVGEASARIDVGARGALLRVPTAGSTGPWRVTARVSGVDGSLDGVGEINVATGQLLGDPVMFRATPAPRSPLRPVADHQFRRNERAHVEWPALTTLDQRSARVLDRRGLPLPLAASLTEREVDGRAVVAVDVSLQALVEGDYIIEVTAGSGGQTERGMMPIRIVR
jgi:VWFA-related protein